MATPLDYAPPLPWRRRGRIQRWAILAALLVTVLLSLRWAPPAWRHAQLLYWQRQAMNYTAPADLVVWDSEAPVVLPAQWIAFSNFSQMPLRPSMYIGRQTSLGDHRIIEIHYAFLDGMLKTPRTLSRSYRPATLTSQLTAGEIDVAFMRKVDRIYAPQPNPDDPSHFTIAYEIDGRPGIIDGWLMDDDTVKLEFRHEPHP